MTKKEKKERLAAICERLSEIYPDAECALKYGGDPWRLLVMARLSAQCTDARVNEVSVELFREFPDAESMARGDISRIEELVKSCGLYRMKAANIKDASAIVAEKYGGELPRTMEELLTLPGVGTPGHPEAGWTPGSVRFRSAPSGSGTDTPVRREWCGGTPPPDGSCPG